MVCAEEKKSGDFYVEAGYANMNVDTAYGDDDLGVGILKFGYNAHENLAIELMAATGLSKGKIDGVKLDLSHAFGIYAKPKMRNLPYNNFLE